MNAEGNRQDDHKGKTSPYFNAYALESDYENPDRQWVAKLPKTDLHVHLGGSIRFSTLCEEAKRQNIPLPDKKQLEELLFSPSKPMTLQMYLQAFHLTESVMKNARTLKRVAYELVEDVAKENVQVMEARFGPTNYVHSQFRLYEVVEAALEGLNQGSKDFGVKTGLIISGIRTDKKATLQAAQIAVNYMEDGVVGFDLAGKEKGYGPKEFVDSFRVVHDNFLPVTVHAGEEYGAKSIAEAINYLNARRIGHGVNLRENEKLYHYVDIYRIALEICLTSNEDTGASYMETHPVRKYFRDGLRVTINTDNRLISQTTVTDELLKMSRILGFNKGDLKILVKNGVKAAFLKAWERVQILDRFDHEFEKLK